MRAILITILLLISTNLVFAAQEDLYSWSWWSTLSGYTTGSINDIIERYLIAQGYTGTTTDKLHKWLADQTGLSASAYTTNDLQYAYFVLGTRAAGGNPQLTFIGSNLQFNGSNLTF